MGLISDGTTIFDAGALDSGLAKGAMTFIKKLTASSSATLSFVDGYCNVTAAIDAVQFKMNSGNIDTGTIKMYGIK